MQDLHRRSVLAVGVTLLTGVSISVPRVGASDADGNSEGDLPDPTLKPKPEMDEDWPSYRGDAGHARFIDDAYEFDGDSLEDVWSVNHTGPTAIADNTLYTTSTDGVVALNTADGSRVWENSDIDAHSPIVVDETVYFIGGEIVALNRTDGSLRWESTLDAGEWTGSHTVAYNSVFVVVDGTLYALEPDDGSVRWQKDSAVVESSDGEKHESEFITGTAASNGVVYAATEAGTLAFDPATGETIWQDDTGNSNITDQAIYATEAAVLVERTSPELGLYDANTGERLGLPAVSSRPALSNESVIGGNDYSYDSHSIRGDKYDWSIDVTYTYGAAVISGESIYVYFEVNGQNYGSRDYDQKLVALDKRTGSEKWTLSKDDAPVGHIRAISGETIYVDYDGDLVALRDATGDEDTC